MHALVQLVSIAFVVLEIALVVLLERLIVLLNSQVRCLAFALHGLIGTDECVIDACQDVKASPVFAPAQLYCPSNITAAGAKSLRCAIS